MLRSIVLVVLLAVSGASPASAQLTEAQPGARVRVQAPGVVAGKFEGTILTRSVDTLVVGGPNVMPVRVPLAKITGLEISRGKSRADGAIVGMKWGVPIMAAVGVAVAAGGNADRCTSCSDALTGGDAVAVTAIFALSGAIYGAGIGALIGRERWEQFDLSPRTSLQIRQGRVGLGLTFGF